MWPIFFVLFFFFGAGLQAQTEAPPIYDTEGEEEYKDLAIEKEKPAPKKPAPPTPAETTPTVAEPQEAKPQEKMQVEQAKPIELPSAPVPETKPVAQEPPPPPLPPLPVEQKQPEIPVPSNVPVVQVSPVEIIPSNPDGGPLQDAGGDIQTALPVTYAFYKENSFSPSDTVDIFKLHTRANEGVAVILSSEHPSSQLSCDILNEAGELLSQTKSANPGAPLSFQTTPFEKNDTLYLRVGDLNFLADSPPTELRKYSLDIKPIAALIPPPPPAVPEAMEEKAPTPEQSAAGEKELFEMDWIPYGLIGAGVLIACLVLMIVIRKLNRKKETQ